MGGLALFPALSGIYGMKAHAVSRRVREIGTRMALGASASKTIWPVLKEEIWPIATGTIIGLFLSVAVGKLLSGLLYEVSALNPVVLLTTPLLTGATSALVALLPVLRATRIDPLLALRSE